MLNLLLLLHCRLLRLLGMPHRPARTRGGTSSTSSSCSPGGPAPGPRRINLRLQPSLGLLQLGNLLLRRCNGLLLLLLRRPRLRLLLLLAAAGIGPRSRRSSSRRCRCSGPTGRYGRIPRLLRRLPRVHLMLAVVACSAERGRLPIKEDRRQFKCST